MAAFGSSLFDIPLLLYALILTLVFGASFILFTRFPRLKESALDQPPLVSVIIPVRNQEGTVEACIDSLVGSHYPQREIIVVEGRSEDRTKDILGRFEEQITVLSEPPLPRGWVGKNWACHEGYVRAKGDFLLFTDGDTVHHPDLLLRAVTFSLENDVDLLTLSSRLRVESFWERVVQPLMIFLIGLIHRGRWVNRPDKRWAVGNGQFLLFRRETYEALRGHASVAGRVDEDYRLAQRAKNEGYRVMLVDGRDGLEVRMYTSLREIWNGWSKNAFAGLDFSLRRTVNSTIGLLLLMVLPYILLAWATAGLLTMKPSLLFLVSAFLCGLIWTRLAVIHAQLGGKARYGFLTPVGALVIAAILINSARRYRRHGGVAWKGRVYGIPEK